MPGLSVMRCSFGLWTLYLLFSCVHICGYQFITPKSRQKSVQAFQPIHYNPFSTRKYLLNEYNTFYTAISTFIENPSNGLIIDMMTAAALGVISDCIAQISSHDFEDGKSSKGIINFLLKKWKYDQDRSGRFAIFGFFDGAIGHTWFYTLEHFVKDSTAVDIITKVVVDTIVSQSAL